MSGLVIDSVRKAFGATQVLHGVSLSVRPGEFVALLGPSGCGKSTLMRIIAGIDAPDAGRVIINDRDVTRAHPGARDVAMVFQNYALYPHLTVRQNIAVPLVMRRLSAWQRLPFLGGFAGAARRAIAADVERIAEPLGLAPLLDRRPAQLSGGQRQRVALARAVVRAPHVFLLDEPLSNLDAALRVTTRREIVDIHRRVGAASLYVTHDQSEALTMADRVAVMLGGRLLQCAAPADVYDRPANLDVARFIGSPAINLLPAEARDDGWVQLAGRATGLATAARGPLTLGVRPEAWRIGAGGWPARVEHTEFLGDGLLVHARLDDHAVLLRAEPDARIAVGDVLPIGFDPARALVFGADGARVAAVEPAHA